MGTCYFFMVGFLMCLMSSLYPVRHRFLAGVVLDGWPLFVISSYVYRSVSCSVVGCLNLEKLLFYLRFPTAWIIRKSFRRAMFDSIV